MILGILTKPDQKEMRILIVGGLIIAIIQGIIITMANIITKPLEIFGIAASFGILYITLGYLSMQIFNYIFKNIQYPR
jgi:uncharacterized PurR-regulated membrane protein YhhQ (DUF165 family)